MRVKRCHFNVLFIRREETYGSDRWRVCAQTGACEVGVQNDHRQMTIVKGQLGTVLGALSVLLLDDDPVFRSTTNTTLRNAGCRDFVQTGDPRRAFEVIGTRPPDLLLLDVHRAAFDGLAVLRQLRQTAEGRALPVLIFTTSTSGADATAARALKTLSWVIKPVQPATLLGHVAATVIPGMPRPEGCQLALLADAYEARLIVGLQDLAHLANRVFTGHRSFADCGEELQLLLQGLKVQSAVLGYDRIASLCTVMHELNRMVAVHAVLAPVSGELVRLIRVGAVAMLPLAEQKLRGDGGALGALLMEQLGTPLLALQGQLTGVLNSAEAMNRAAMEAMAVRKAEVGTESWRLRRQVTLATSVGTTSTGRV